MDGEEPSGDKGKNATPHSSPVSAPNSEYGKNIYEKQTSITEQEFVDRIKRSDRWMIGLTGVLAATGILSAVIFWNQLGTMRDQIDEMRVEQRPWIKIDSISVNRISTKDGTPHFELTYNISNVGRTPAVKVFVRSAVERSAKFITVGGKGGTLREFCEEDNGDVSNDVLSFFYKSFGFGKDIVFPGSQDFMNAEATDRYRKETIPKAGWSGGGKTAIEEGTILLFSCITYQESEGGTLFRTGTTTEIAPIAGSIQFTDGVEIPGSRVKIQRPSFGWENYAE